MEPTPSRTRELGTVQGSELLLGELYVDLRRKIRAWSEVTRQTPQARMGYVGQHLVSVVTGYPGGRSGARGHDLELPDDQWAEIKTCYRVDQLGSCLTCGAPVSSIEFICPRCGGTKIVRKDDSKWLIGIRNDEEMSTLFDPVAYYLVLFDFSAAEAAEVKAATGDGDVEVVTDRPLDINARIWEVDPKHPGFALCMVDYYTNIRAKSVSKAPFNLWPYSLKFQLMNPLLIYHAVIRADDTVDTRVFPSTIGDAVRYPVAPFPAMRGSRRNLGDDKLRVFATEHDVPPILGATRLQILDRLQAARGQHGWDDEWLSRNLAELMYRGGIADSEGWLPSELRR